MVETFGVTSGYSSLMVAFLAGVDRAIIPEVPYDPEKLAYLALQDKAQNPNNYAVITVSDGAVIIPDKVRQYTPHDAVEQAKRFNDAIGIDAVILTKIDADAKGGAALSITKTIGKPIAYVSIGQEYDEFKRFDADWMVSRIFGAEQDKASDEV